MKKIFTFLSVIIFISLFSLINMQCSTGSATIEDTVKAYYSSINKGDYVTHNPDFIAGWADKNDSDKKYLQEFQGSISETFKQHQGLKEVKILSAPPAATTAEASLDIELLCNDGYTESISVQLIKEGENWKVVQ